MGYSGSPLLWVAQLCFPCPVPAFVAVTFVPSVPLERLEPWVWSPCVGAVHYLSAFCSCSILCQVSGQGRASSCLFFTQEEFFLLTLVFLYIFFKNRQLSTNPLLGFYQPFLCICCTPSNPFPPFGFISLPFCEDWYPGGSSAVPALLPALFPGDLLGCPELLGGFSSVWGCSCTPALLPWGSGVVISPRLLCKCENPAEPFLWRHP